MSQPSIGWETGVDYSANDKRAEEVYNAVSQWSMDRSIYFTWEEKKDLPKYYWGSGDLMQYNTWAYDLERFFPNKIGGYWYVKMKDSDPVLVDYVIWCSKSFTDTDEWNAYSDVNKGYYKG